jgi:antitoxin (DNA-binding transcriptional repressor) of toxin-antitoxin stability system
MLFEVDIAEAGARFAELAETIAAGYGVLIKRGDEIVCRLVPESAFAEKPEEDEDDGLTAEQRHAKDVLGAFQSMMNDEF